MFVSEYDMVERCQEIIPKGNNSYLKEKSKSEFLPRQKYNFPTFGLLANWLG